MGNGNHAFERKTADGFPELPGSENKLSDPMIKQSLNSVIAKYHDLAVSRRSMIDLLATDKSRYFCQPRPTTVNYFFGHFTTHFCL